MIETIENPNTGKAWTFPRDARRYRAAALRVDFLCRYGHFGCAAWEGGPCEDEELHALEEKEGSD